jgi:hypothetical protein
MRNLFLLIFLVISPFMASAQLVNHGGALGPNSLVTDSNTGLTWLTLDQTLGMSFAEISSNLEDGSRWEDFRIATSEEVYSLFEYIVGRDSGSIWWRRDGVSYDPALVVSSQVLATTLGVNFDDEGYVRVGGFTSELRYPCSESPECPHWFESFSWSSAPDDQFATIDDNWTVYGVNDRLPWMGAWLISENVRPIPEPSTYALMLSGLVGVWFSVRNRRRCVRQAD